MLSESVTQRGRKRKERERESEIPDAHQQTGGTHKRRAGREEKNGHISQAPENVLVIFGRVLLIDECGSV